MARTYPQIGSQSWGVFLSMSGLVRTADQSLAEYSRGGIDGKGYQKMGLRPEPFQLLTVVALSGKDDISDRMDNYKSLEGTLVSIVDSMGVTWTKILVRRVDSIDEQSGARALVVGGTTTVNPPNARAMLAAQWTCEVTTGTTHN